jgi:hypothetical protein
MEYLACCHKESKRQTSLAALLLTYSDGMTAWASVVLIRKHQAILISI